VRGARGAVAAPSKDRPTKLGRPWRPDL
jgi:hypothetical protein